MNEDKDNDNFKVTMQLAMQLEEITITEFRAIDKLLEILESMNNNTGSKK